VKVQNDFDKQKNAIVLSTLSSSVEFSLLISSEIRDLSYLY